MNTSKLQAFAAGARVELMRAVRAKLDAAMEPNSAARVDSPQAFDKLEGEVRANGGGEEGRAKTAERHAYRWFNQIIALRYMDANEFTSPHVVSGDDADNPNALPGVLSAAKRGEFDENVFDGGIGAKTKMLPTIQALLNGTKPSNDPQGEAYGLLLRATCDYWHKFMPFMFDESGAADELLLPADLLASDSVLRKAVEAMPVADCVGSEGQGNVEIIGWLYQFYIAERKDEVMAGFKKSKKAGAAEIPAATQLFTPDWIVRYLVQNTVGRLWTQNHPESRLHESWEYYIDSSSAPSAEGAPGVAGWGSVSSPLHGEMKPTEGVLRITTPEDLTICDPACGSGHMLTYAFDLLYDIYDEAGYSANEIPGLILEHNLFGMEIDERAADLAAFALTMKARGRYRRFFRKGRQVQPNIQRITPEYFTDTEVQELNDLYDVTLDVDTWNTYQRADVYGSLIQPPADLTKLAAASAPSAEGAVERSETEGAYTLLSPGLEERSHTVLTQTAYLARKYAAVVANPPYLSSKNMDAELKTFIKDKYPDGRTDLFSAFILRNKKAVKVSGLLGMITMQGWMFLSAFYELRKEILSTSTIDSLIHLGSGAFDSIGGEIVSTAAFVIENARASRSGIYCRLVDIHGDHKQSEYLRRQLRDGSRKTVYYVNQKLFSKMPSEVIVYWLPALLADAFIKIAKGFTTGDNNIFLRQWFESSLNSIDFRRTKWDEQQVGKWVPCDKGGEFRKWYGNDEFIIDWTENGTKLLSFPSATPRNAEMTFSKSIACSYVASDNVSFRFHDGYHAFTGSAVCVRSSRHLRSLHCFLNSSVAYELLKALSPTISFEAGQLRSLPFMLSTDFENQCASLHEALITSSRSDWDSYETSWDFKRLEVLGYSLVGCAGSSPDKRSWDEERAEASLPLSEAIPAYIAHCKQIAEEQRQREIKNNELVADAYGVRDEVPCDVPIERVSLKRNPAFAYPKATPAERDAKMVEDVVREIISYAVGCMFGRYSLDKPGLILASQGETIDDYLREISNPTFEPDADNVIPVTDDEWFEDDLAARFRTFLATALGEQHVNENIAYIEQVLGKPLRKYFAMDFYDDHVKMYKNRPIYWMYSSRTDNKGAFKALVYLHRYAPVTTNTVLKYLREFTGKLNAQSEALLASGKPAEVRKGEKLRTTITECTSYERDILYPLATANLPIDLDDGVLVNYLRMGQAVRAIKPIEAKRNLVQSWTWPTNPLEG